MNIADQLFLGLAVSMDAFAVSICLGLASRDKSKQAIEAFLWFGLAQAIMATIGYFLGSTFAVKIEAVDHWIAFGLLAVIGANMIKEALEERRSGDVCERNPKMLMLAIATSIDSLAVGVSISMVTRTIVSPAIIIGLCTGIISAIGVVFGNIIGSQKKFYAQVAGGVILILLGIKIVVEAFI